MPSKPSTDKTYVNVCVRVEAGLLRDLHRMAERQDLPLGTAARHLMVLGLEQLQTAA